MPRFEIWGEKGTEKVIRLKLTNIGGEIHLEAVDKNGKRRENGNILYIDEKGVHILRSLNKDIGLPVTVNNFVKVTFTDSFEETSQNDFIR